MEAFEEAATIARDNHLPLIIHSVKSSNEIIQLRKKIGEDSIWIMHGFRGKKELASEYLKMSQPKLYQQVVDKLSNAPQVDDVVKSSAKAKDDSKMNDGIRSNLRKFL